MNISEKILQLIEKENVTKKLIYDSLNVTRQGFADKLKKEYFTTVELKKLASIFNIPITDFFESNAKVSADVPNYISVYKVPVKAYAGYISNGSQIQSMNLEKITIVNDNYDVENTRLFEVEGDSMLPKIDWNDILICVREETIFLRRGKIYVFVTDSDILVKYLGGIGAETLLLKSENTLYSDIHLPKDEIKEIWKVIKAERTF
jgi:phage repressor protein C with HTH and peptisase S24 domain